MAEKAKPRNVAAKTDKPAQSVAVVHSKNSFQASGAAPTPLPHADTLDPGALGGVVPDVSLIVRIDLGIHGRLGPGKVLLLQRIEQSGSISAAARSMNMSYRQAWDLVDQLNSAFEEAVVASQTGGRAGGGAVLTPFGKELVDTVLTITALAEDAAAPKVKALRANLRPASGRDGTAAGEFGNGPAADE